MSQPEAKRRWYQFSLRTLLIVVTVVAGLAGTWHMVLESYRHQREALAAIVILGGTCETEQAPLWVRWLDDNAQEVIDVHLRKRGKASDYLPHLARLPHVRMLTVGCEIGDEELVFLKGMTSLEYLDLNGSLISDAGLQHITGLSHLQTLWVANTSISDAGMALIADLPMIRNIDVSRTPVSDEGLRHLQRCHALERLLLGGTRITDTGVAYLDKCSRLSYLYIEDTPQVSRSGIQRLQAALPTCLIAK